MHGCLRMLGLSALVLIHLTVVSPSVQQPEVLSSTNEPHQLDTDEFTSTLGHGGYSARQFSARAQKWLAALRNATRSPYKWIDAETPSNRADAKAKLDPSLPRAAWRTGRRLAGPQLGHGSKSPRQQHMPHKQGQHRTCHPDCTKRGNCNTLDGRCECPYGLTGEACEQLAFPACRTVNLTVQEAEAAGTPLVITCTEDMHLNCECYRQCWLHECAGEECIGHRQASQKCFSYTGLPPEQQVSVFPAASWTNITYSVGFGLPKPAVESNHPAWQQHSSGLAVVPQQRCPDACNGRGLCGQVVSKDGSKQQEGEEEHRCLCAFGYSGDACELVDAQYCMGKCSGRGECQRGFCHCQLGYFGAGCSKAAAKVQQQGQQQSQGQQGKQSKQHSDKQKGQQQEQQPQGQPQGQGQGQQPGQRRSPSPRLKIFIYDLPWHVAFEDGYYPAWLYHDPNYLSFREFADRLVADTSVLTQDSSQASLFFVPALAYYYSDNTGDPAPQVLRVINFIRHTYPYWNATGGTDHFYFVLNDRGTCIMNPSRHLLWAPIKLVHFGAFSANLSSDMHLALQGRQGYGCFRPDKDVVLAPTNEWLLGLAQATYLSEEGKKELESAHERPVLLAFAGTIQPDEPEYSGAARQALHKLFKSERTSLPKPKGGKDSPPVRWQAEQGEVLIHEGYTEWHGDWMRQARFCLAPYGHGWGIRLSIVIAAGCVPLIIQDHVFQPYEDLLPYEAFSLRLPVSDIPRIKDILAALPHQEWRRLHQGLARWWRYFVWEAEVGGLAYNATIASLRRRLSHRLGGISSAS